MTIEFSLRRRAAQGRWLAIAWLTLATAILLVTYFSLPAVSNRILDQANAAQTGIGAIGVYPKDGAHSQLYAMATIFLGIATIAFACFLLGRAAFVEIELAARCAGLADALCIAGNDFNQLQKAAAMLVPEPGYLSIPEIFSRNTRESLMEVLKLMRKE